MTRGPWLVLTRKSLEFVSLAAESVQRFAHRKRNPSVGSCWSQTLPASGLKSFSTQRNYLKGREGSHHYQVIWPACMWNLASMLPCTSCANRCKPQFKALLPSAMPTEYHTYLHQCGFNFSEGPWATSGKQTNQQEITWPKWPQGWPPASSWNAPCKEAVQSKARTHFR